METAVSWAALKITSPEFIHEGRIPAKFTCEGQGINPSLSVEGLPDETKTIALIMDDPDAPGKVFDHWIVWNIPPRNQIRENSVPGVVGLNSLNTNNYTGPCPPSGTHRYFFKLYALDTSLTLDRNAGKSEVEKAMTGHILAFGELIGLYEKKGSH